MRPSSSSTTSPAVTSLTRLRYATPTACSSPAFGSIAVSRTNCAPSVRTTGPFLNDSILIFGPCKSPMMPMWRPTLAAISRTVATRAAWSADVPCEKLMRNTSAPATINCSSTAGSSVAGPKVATIFVRRRISSCVLAGTSGES